MQMYPLSYETKKIIIMPQFHLQPTFHTGIVLISSPFRLGPDVFQSFPYVSEKPLISINIILGSDTNLLDVDDLKISLDLLGHVLDVLSVRHWQ